MKKDYRTWWRKGTEVCLQFNDIFSGKYGYWLEHKNFRIDQLDCILEQVWAIRNGLSEEVE